MIDMFHQLCNYCRILTRKLVRIVSWFYRTTALYTFDVVFEMYKFRKIKSFSIDPLINDAFFGSHSDDFLNGFSDFLYFLFFMKKL